MTINVKFIGMVTVPVGFDVESLNTDYCNAVDKNEFLDELENQGVVIH